MDIENKAYLLTKMLCKAYKLRKRKEYPTLAHDPVYPIRRMCNLELDTLTEINSRDTVKGFNRAFNEIMGH